MRYQYCAANKLQRFRNVQMQEKCTFSFLVYVHVCITIMVEFQEVNAGRDCVWSTILGAGLHTTCRGERVLLVIMVQCNILPSTPKLRKNVYILYFLKDAESLTTCGCMLWCNRMLQCLCSDVTVFVWGRVHVTTHSHFIWHWPRLDPVSYSGCGVVPSVTG